MNLSPNAAYYTLQQTAPGITVDASHHLGPRMGRGR